MRSPRLVWFLRGAFAIVIALRLGSILIDKAKVGLSGGGTVDLLSCSYRYCETVMGQGDARWYLESGRALVEGRGIPEELLWVYSIWPPGMAAINAAALSVLGIDVKIGLVHGTINVLLWTVLLSAPLWIARTPKLVAICGVISVAMTWLTIFPDWVLGSGILYADGISTAILLLAYGLLIFGRPTRIRKSVIPMVLCSGAMIGVSAYLRSSVEALVLGTTIVIIVACAVFVVVRTVRIRKAEARLKASRSRRFRELRSDCRRSRLCWVLVAFLAAQAVMLPWRVYLHNNVTSSYSFSTTGDQAFAFGWMPTSRLDPRTLEWGWFLNGFCVAYPARCAAIEENELRSANPYGGGNGGHFSFAEFRYFAVIDIATDPAPWVQQRGTHLVMTWWPQRLNSSFRASLNEALALAAVAFVVVLSALTSRRRREVTPVVLVGTLLLITILLPMLTHFEERYLYPAKALALFLPYFIADSAHLGFRNWLSMRRSGRARD